MPGMVFCVNIVHSEPDRYVHLFFDLKLRVLSIILKWTPNAVKRSIEPNGYGMNDGHHSFFYFTSLVLELFFV